MGINVVSGVFYNYEGSILTAFGSFLGHHLILFVESMTIWKGLEMAA